MNQSLENLRYLSRSNPLEHQITFDEAQNREIGYQTAIPRDTVHEQMNSLEFKAMEGALFEAANMASGQIRSEKDGDSGGSRCCRQSNSQDVGTSDVST